MIQSITVHGSFFNNNPSSSNKRKLNFDAETKDDSKCIKIDATEVKNSNRVNVTKAVNCDVADDCPEGYDRTVWSSLPDFIKEDILQSSSSQPSSSRQSEEHKPPDDAFPCPTDVDPDIFHQLPDDIKQEIIRDRKAKTPPSAKKKSDITKYFNVKSSSKMK